MIQTKGYRAFVEEGLKKEIINPLKEVVANLTLGSKEFVQRLRDKVGFYLYTKIDF